MSAVVLLADGNGLPLLAGAVPVDWRPVRESSGVETGELLLLSGTSEYPAGAVGTGPVVLLADGTGLPLLTGAVFRGGLVVCRPVRESSGVETGELPLLSGTYEYPGGAVGTRPVVLLADGTGLPLLTGVVPRDELVVCSPVRESRGVLTGELPVPDGYEYGAGPVNNGGPVDNGGP